MTHLNIAKNTLRDVGTLPVFPILTKDGFDLPQASSKQNIICFDTKSKSFSLEEKEIEVSDLQDVEVFRFDDLVLDPRARFLQHRITCKACGKGWSDMLFDMLILGQPTKIVTQIPSEFVRDLNIKDDHPFVSGHFYKFKSNATVTSNDNPFLSFFFQFGLKKELEFKREVVRTRLMKIDLNKNKTIIIKNGNIAMFSGINYDTNRVCHPLSRYRHPLSR